MYFFRADGNSIIGMGHLMRSLSIAVHMKEMQDVCFICSDNNSSSYVENWNLKAVTLSEIPFSEEEAQKIVSILENEDTEKYIIIDSYLVNSKYLEIIRKQAKVAVLDDLIEDIIEADAVVNYNTYATEQAYLGLYKDIIPVPKFVIGKNLVPVRDEFFEKDFSVTEKVADVLITVGGADEFNLAYLIASKLVSHSDITFHIVSGRFNKNIEALKNISSKNYNIVIHENVSDMATLMSQCQVAISAGGSTCYELCAIGIPFIVFAYAKNQTLLAKQMGLECGRYAGYIENPNSKEEINEVVERISLLFEELINNFEARCFVSDIAKKTVKKDGAMNLAIEIKRQMEGKK